MRHIEVAPKATVTITLGGMNLSASSGLSALLLNADANVTLILADGTDNTFTGNNSNSAGIQTTGAMLTIEGGVLGTGTLTATGGNNSAGIGGGANATGSNDGGTIIINGGKITATGTGTAAGIGGGGNTSAGADNSGGNITINGGDITATGGSGIGGGGGGATGGSYANNDGGVITINGGTIHATSVNNCGGAGIGGGGYDCYACGYGGTGGTITITGGTIIAETTGNGAGAGIGGGGVGNSGNGDGGGGNITITGGDITATVSGANSGAGIGGGGNGDGGNITISGGTITATGAVNIGAAGIGGGLNGAGGNIIISGGTVSAIGNGSAAGIGGGGRNGTTATASASGNILIYGENTVVTAKHGTIAGTIAQDIGAGSLGATLGAVGSIFIAIPQGNLTLSGTPGITVNPVPFTATPASADVVTVTLLSPFDADPFSAGGVYDLMTGLGTAGVGDKTFSVYTSPALATETITFGLNGYDVNPDPVTGDPAVITGAYLLTSTAHIDFSIADYELTLSQTGTLDFGSQTLGYAAQTPQTIAVSNTGNRPTGTLSVALSGTNANDFAISADTVSGQDIAFGGQPLTFQIAPKTGLTGGAHTATVTVTGSKGGTASFDVTFYVRTYGVSLSQTGTLDFGSATFGYAAQTPQAVTVTNTGNQATGTLTVGVSNTDFVISNNNVSGGLAAGALNTFSVAPALGLAAGTHTATVTVTGSNGISASFTVTFTVKVDAETPTISSQPQSASYTQNDSATALTVAANVTDGGTLTYQWYNASGAITGAIGTSYTTSTTATGTFTYYVIVTNTNNAATGATTATATSNTATITVTAPVGTCDIDLSITNPAASFAGCWTYSNPGNPTGVYTIVDGADLSVTGDGSNQRRIEIAADATATVTLNGVTITGLGANQSALLLNTGADVTLILADGSTNALTGGSSSAGIQTTGATLTIDGETTGTGVLTASGGSSAAGIGGGNSNNNGDDGGTIIINGGTVNATGSGAGIGGGHGISFGSSGNGGSITINGGDVTATSNGGAGIGNGGSSYASNGNGGNITITGGTVNATGASSGAAGIGGAGSGSGGNIIISDGTVTATGGSNASGIGGSNVGNSGNILIYGENTIVTAKGSNGAADIGAGTSGTVNSIFVALPKGNLQNASGIIGNDVVFTADPASGGIVTATLPAPFNADPFSAGGVYDLMTGLDATGKTFSVIATSRTNTNIPFALLNYDVAPDPATSNGLMTTGATVKFTLPAGTPLTFAYNSAFDIPASTVGTDITPIDVSTGVSGGTIPYTFEAIGLPGGITIGGTTGVISGAPTTPGAVGTATITVKDNAGASESITINYGAISAAALVDAQTPTITTQPVDATYTQNGSAADLIVAANVTDGGTLTYQWYNASGAITGAIGTSYTPSTTATGTFTYYVIVTNTNNDPAITGATTATRTSNTATVTVNAAVNAQTPTITTQPVDATYTQNDSATALTLAANVTDGGTLTYQWYNASGAITGAIGTSYTPDTTATGAFTYYVIVTNTNNAATGLHTATATSNTVTITVNVSGGSGAPVITSVFAGGALPSGTVDTPYSVTLTASPAATSWMILAGALPPGLNITSAGVITGTPTATGTFTFSVIASNGAGQSMPVQFNLLINPKAGAAQSIPTLNPMMLLLLAMVLAVAATVTRQKRRSA
ncbi:MAG: putative Ig domain-containing protein [Burkholderiales bacterium]|nr:putative Ig domain-containing protein [Burkholderiales bacterium]